MREQLEGKKIKCRLCQGNHFTSRCPHKETLGGMEEDVDGVDAEADPALAAATAGGTGKYIPPSLRDGGRKGAGESMYRQNRDDMPTLRVTNLSEDVTEPDLWELFARFGKVSRIFVGRDQETGMCKGFAFVSFEEKAEAEKAMGRINGLPCAFVSLASLRFELTLYTPRRSSHPAVRLVGYVFCSCCVQAHADRLAVPREGKPDRA